MKRIFLLIGFVLLLNSVTHSQEEIKISLKNGSKDEQQTKEQLQRLLKSYDLSKWIMTKTIEIDEKAMPHSHPVLTLNTRHLKDDELLLSTFVHEQMHWFVIQDQQKLAVAIKYLKEMFPKVPVGFPEGARDEDSSYLHIAVVYLEYRANREILGELKAKQVMDFWTTDHYRWIYKTVLERSRDIGNIMFKHKLVPILSKQTSTDNIKDSKSSNANQSDSKNETYFVVLYTIGENWDPAKQPNEQTFFKEHSLHLAKLIKEKKIKVGGRYSDTGMLLIKAKDSAEAKNMIAEDVAVKNKLFKVEIFPLTLFYKGSVE